MNVNKLEKCQGKIQKKIEPWLFPHIVWEHILPCTNFILLNYLTILDTHLYSLSIILPPFIGRRALVWEPCMTQAQGDDTNIQNDLRATKSLTPQKMYHLQRLPWMHRRFSMIFFCLGSKHWTISRLFRSNGFCCSQVSYNFHFYCFMITFICLFGI